MACKKHKCLGSYDFEKIAYFARKKYIEGFSTIELLTQAKSELEKKVISLVCLLDVDDDEGNDLQITCKNKGNCIAVNYRLKLKRMLKAELTCSAA